METASQRLLFDLLFVAGLTTNLFLLLLLWKTAKRHLATSVLALIFVVTFLIVIAYYAHLHAIVWLAIAAWILAHLGIWCLGPLLLLYVKALYRPSEGLPWRQRGHFGGAVVLFGLLSVPNMGVTFPTNWGLRFTEWVQTTDVAAAVQAVFLAAYAVLALAELTRSEEKIRRVFAQVEGFGLRWIRVLLLGLITVCAVDLSTTFYEAVWGELRVNSGYFTVIALIFLLGYLAYNGLIQSRTLLLHELLQELAEPTAVDAPSTARSVTESTLAARSLLRPEEEQQIGKKLTHVFQTEAIYKDRKLTIASLAAAMNVPPRKLSVFLNQHLQLPFFDLVNQYRVQAVQEMLDSGAYHNYTLLAIGLEAGFNSKTSFYRIFKKYKGVSPAKYQARQSANQG